MRRALLLAFLLLACDDLNKPMNHPQSPHIPTTSGSGSDAGTPADSDAAVTAPPGPAPTITPQPGDIQL